MQQSALEVTNIGITVPKMLKEQESSFLARQNFEENNSCTEHKMFERHNQEILHHAFEAIKLATAEGVENEATKQKLLLSLF